MSEDYNTNEYLFTNEERIFGGNALELMVALYKSEQLPVRVRLYAAAKAVEFESDKSGRTLEELKEEVRQEFTGGTDYQEEILARLERLLRALIGALLTALWCAQTAYPQRFFTDDELSGWRIGQRGWCAASAAAAVSVWSRADGSGDASALAVSEMRRKPATAYVGSNWWSTLSGPLPRLQRPREVLAFSY
jgi:hypothetical protein